MIDRVAEVLATMFLSQGQTGTKSKSKNKKKDNTQQQSSQKSFAEILDKELKRQYNNNRKKQREVQSYDDDKRTDD